MASNGLYAHHVWLIASAFQVPGRFLLRSRARLFGDRIELEGWSLRGRYHRCIPLSTVVHLESYARGPKPHLTLFLENEEVTIVYMKDVFLWRTLFEDWLRYDILPSAKLVGGLEQATALAG